MGAKSIGNLFLLGVDILTTTIAEATKKITAQIGDVNGAGQAEGDNVEWVQHVGFASRPPKAEPGKQAAKGFGIRHGSRNVLFGSQDVRGLEIYGALADGETAVYATGEDGKGQARALFKKNGSVTLYTKQGNTEGGTGMMIQLDAAGGGFTLLDSYGNGIVSGPDGLTLTAKGAALTLGQNGDAKLVAKGKAQMDGSSVVLGSNVVPVVKAALTGPTGIAGVASLKVLIE